MRSKDQLRLLTPADAVAINRKMRDMRFDWLTLLESLWKYQPNVVLLVIGLPPTVARSGPRTSPGQAVDPQALQEFMVAPAKQLSTR
jgi:hypothetical protein